MFVVVVVVLTLTHGYNAVRGRRTGSNNSGAEDYLRRKAKQKCRRAIAHISISMLRALQIGWCLLPQQPACFDHRVADVVTAFLDRHVFQLKPQKHDRAEEWLTKRRRLGLVG